MSTRVETPEEFAARVTADWPPLTPEQVEKAARVLATVTHEEHQQ